MAVGSGRTGRIEQCETIVTCVSWIYEAVGVMAERAELDDDELIRILRAAARIKELALKMKDGVSQCAKTTP